MNIPNYDDKYLMFGLLFILGNRLQVIGDKFYDEITTKQWFVLVILDVYVKNHPTINELSEAVGSSHQNVKQLVLKLEQKGYVELYSDDSDKRKRRVKLTDKCNGIRQKYQIKQNEFMETLFNGIDSETIKIAAKALTKLEENMEMMK